MRCRVPVHACLLGVVLSVLLSACDTSALSVATPAGTSPGCREQSTLLGPDTATTLGFGERALVALLEGSFNAPLRWINYPASRVAIEITPRASYFVASSYDPELELAPGLRPSTPQCMDYVRVDAKIVVRTTDGMLSETIEHASFVAYSPYEAYARFELSSEQITGEYAPRLRGQRCFLGARFRVLIERENFSGSITDLFSPKDCGEPNSPIDSFAAAGWGLRWQSY